MTRIPIGAAALFGSTVTMADAIFDISAENIANYSTYILRP